MATVKKKLASDRAPYEPQPGESKATFARFVFFRDSEDRSLTATAEQFGVEYTSIVSQSQLWLWNERVEAWDRKLDTELRNQHIKDARSSTKRHLDLARALQAVGGSCIKRLIDQINAGEPVKVSVAEARRLVEVGVKLERLALNQPTEISAKRMADLNPEELTDDQIARLLNGEDVERVVGIH